MNLSIKHKIKCFMKPGDGLRQRVARGTIWVFSTRGISETLKFVRLVILARLLAPGDFGLMGIALLTMAALEQFTEPGFNKALIQKKGSTREYLDTAWTVNGLRGLILCSILVLVAPYVVSFFNEPAGGLIVQVVALSVFIKGWENIGRIYFDKELEFNKKFAYEVGGAAVGLLAAIAAVFILGNVWALVFGLLAGDVARFILSYLLHPYRPHPRLDLVKARELFNFGKWILGSSVLIFLVTQGPSIVVGKLLTVSALGLYQMAYRISNMPATHITRVISQVTFPAYSKLQENIPKLRGAYLKVLQIIAFIAILVAGGIFVLAPDFTQIFLGENWMPMVPAMQLLAIAGLIRSLQSTAGNLFTGVGKPHIDTRWQVIRLIVLGILIYPLALQWGILGISLAVCLSILATAIGCFFSVIKIIGCRVKDLSKLIVFPLISGVIAVLLIFALKDVISGIGIFEFLIFVCVGILCYLIITHLQDKLLNYKMRSLIKESLTSLNG